MPLDLEHASDAELLACFAAGRDQRAFAQLVARHGPMVMGVAMRMLGSRHDAEDAFQAAFLALAGAAARLRRRAAVGAWLHRTTVRAARSIQRMNAKWKRNVQERSQRAPTEYTPRQQDDLRELLDAELAMLPPKLRSAIVLCDLEGLSRNEAAERLGITASTLRNHVAEGRTKLRSRLIKRGIGLSVAGLAAHLADLAKASSPLSSTIIQTTSTNALHFAAGKSAAEIGVSISTAKAAQGVITAMTVTKFSMIGAAALAIVFGVTAIDGVSRVLSLVANAETIFFDDFNDGDASDGLPVTWVTLAGFNNGNFSAASGDFVISEPPVGSPQVAYPQIPVMADTSVRAQVRHLVGRGAIGLVVRGDPDTGASYQAGIYGVGNLYIDRLSGPFTNIALDELQVSLDPTVEDIVLQFDAIGDQLNLYAWRAGEPKPALPILSAVDDTYATGLPALLIDGVAPHSVAYRYVHVADASIPEPSTAMLSAVLFAGVFAWQWRRSR